MSNCFRSLPVDGILDDGPIAACKSGNIVRLSPPILLELMLDPLLHAGGTGTSERRGRRAFGAGQIFDDTACLHGPAVKVYIDCRCLGIARDRCLLGFEDLDVL